MVKTGVQWFLTQTGAAASAHLEAGGFIRSAPDVPHPDLQFHFLPSVVVNHGSGLGDCHAFQVNTQFQYHRKKYFTKYILTLCILLTL